jgi:hypothetical protein
MSRYLSAAGLMVLLVSTSAVAADEAPKVSVLPATPLIEVTQDGQRLNFDLLVDNSTGKPLELVTVRAVVRDASGAVARRIEVNDNGIAPGIQTLPDRKYAAGDSRTVFNPFHSFPARLPLARVDYELVFRGGDGKAVSSAVTVRPQVYRTRTRLRLPLAGRMLVWDGHDYLSHHRRFDLIHPMIRQVGWNANSSRYSLDLVLTDKDGSKTRGEGKANADYYGYGQPVLAPGDGVVVKANGSAPDNAGGNISLGGLKVESMSLFGNYVVIDHGDGEFSELGHLKPGSVVVHVGDHVKAGQMVGRIGASGSSLFPHLHYQLVSAPDAKSEGLPAEFQGYDEVLGARKLHVARGVIDSGDIVEGPPAR